LRELLEWANVILVEDPLELALCRREQPAGRYVFVAHGVGEMSSVSMTGHDRFPEALATSELTIATSAADRRELVSRYGLPGARVVEVPSAVDVEALAPVDPETRSRLRKELGLPDGPVVAFTGGATPASRAGLSWVRRLAEHDRRFTFLVAGGVAERERRENLIVVGKVRDVAPYLQAADAAVCPVEYPYGTRHKLLEALAAGLPCVVFSEALHGTGLEDGRHVLVAGKSEHELLEALARLTTDAELAGGLGSRGRAYVVDHHDARLAAAILEEALLDLLAARPGAPSGNGSPASNL
jgi:glycosyltransferase involved in cell wall biosynthesis